MTIHALNPHDDQYTVCNHAINKVAHTLPSYSYRALYNKNTCCRKCLKMLMSGIRIKAVSEFDKVKLEGRF